FLIPTNNLRSINAALLVIKVFYANLCQSLRLRDLRRGHLGSDDVAVLERLVAVFLVSRVGGREVKPRMRLNVVLRQAMTTVIHDAEVELRAGIALLGSLAIPPRRLSVILRHALASRVHNAEVVLGIGKAIFGGL